MKAAIEYNKNEVGTKLKSDQILPEDVQELAKFIRSEGGDKMDLLKGCRFSENIYDKILCQDQIELDNDLDIDWTRSPSMPTCIQECGIGIINNHLIYFCGYCAGPGGRKGGKCRRGFSNKCFGYNLKSKNWITLPVFPGQGRQGLRTVVIDDQLYTWGGWTYQPMKERQINNIPQDQWPAKIGCRTFSDGYKLSFTDGNWVWEKMLSMPFPRTNYGICHQNRKIYICAGGQIIDGQMATSSQFNNLYVLDLDRTDQGWNLLGKFSGTSRINCSMSCVGENIYILGGIFPNNIWKYNAGHISRLRTVLDQWKYNILSGEWSQMIDNVIETGNWGGHDQIVFQNRYIIVGGGTYFPEMMKMGEIVKQKIKPCMCHRLRISHCGCGNTFLDRIYGFDAVTEKFLRCKTNLPGLINLPLMKVVDNKIYLLGGETYGFKFSGEVYYRPHLDIHCQGEIKMIDGPI